MLACAALCFAGEGEGVRGFRFSKKPFGFGGFWALQGRLATCEGSFRDGDPRKETVRVGSSDFKIKRENGLEIHGGHRVTFWRIHICDAALYLDPEQVVGVGKQLLGGEELLDPKIRKAVVLKYVIDIRAKDLKSWMRNHLEGKLKKNAEIFQGEQEILEAFIGFYGDVVVNSGSEITTEYNGADDPVVRLVNSGEEKGRVVSSTFSQLIFSTWLGPTANDQRMQANIVTPLNRGC